MKSNVELHRASVEAAIFASKQRCKELVPVRNAILDLLTSAHVNRSEVDSICRWIRESIVDSPVEFVQCRQ